MGGGCPETGFLMTLFLSILKEHIQICTVMVLWLIIVYRRFRSRKLMCLKLLLSLEYLMWSFGDVTFCIFSQSK